MPLPKPSLARVKKVRRLQYHACNVLHTQGESRQLWQFHRESRGVTLAAERKQGATEMLPPRLVGKSWTHLWQSRLNVAWLPANQVYLRVIQLPACEPEELPAMVEFQLERLSPLPVGQIVWTAEPLPGAPDEPQTVVVIIAARGPVESFLGNLEDLGYLADRLELPQFHELLVTKAHRDGVWIYPRQEEEHTVCLLAWWREQRLQHLSLLLLPAADQAGELLAEAIRQTAWAGEMEGWHDGELHCHLVTDAVTAASLAPALSRLTGCAPSTSEPLPLAKLAAVSAASNVRANLVPPEFTALYRQQFIDRLWMRGLAAVGVVYLAAVVVFLGGLKFLEFQKSRAEKENAALTGSYTNALQLRARVQVLQDQFNLKYAALDCWRAASESLPEDMALTSLVFQRGKRLQVFGSVPADQQPKVTEFNVALSKAAVNGQSLFSQVSTRSIVSQPGRPGNWSIDCDIKRSEVE